MNGSERYGVTIPNGPAAGDNSDCKVKAWADSLGIRFWYGDVVFDMDTWKSEQTYFFKNEQDKLIFLLKWRNTR